MADNNKQKELSWDQIRTGNETIAIFRNMQSNYTGSYKREFATYISTKPENLEYHKDYNWLMNAYLQFRNLKTADIPDARIFDDYKNNIGKFILAGNKKDAFLMLVHAINWLNHQRLARQRQANPEYFNQGL